MMTEVRRRLKDHLQSTTYRQLEKDCGLNIRTLHQIANANLHPRFDERFVKLLTILGWRITNRCR